MQQLALLWDYQQIDMKLEKLEAEVKKLPIRQKLLRCRNTLVDGQKTLEKMDADMAEKEKHFQWISEQYKQAADIAARKKYELETETEFIAEDFLFMSEDGQKLGEVLDKLEHELRSLIEQLDQQSRSINDLVSRMARAKKEYPALREEFDQAQAEYTTQIEQLRKECEEAAKNIEPSVLSRYKAVKKTRTPPIARVNGSQCSGCNMELAAVTMRHARSENEIVECENCGRILYVAE